MEEQPLDYYKALYQLAVEVNFSTSSEDVLDNIVRSTAMAINAKGCSLMLLTPDRKQLIHTVAYGLSDSYIKKGSLKLDPILQEVLNGNPVAINNVDIDPRVQYRAQALKEGIASMISVPVILRGETTGVLRVYTAKYRQFSFDDIQFLNLAASLGAIALKKAREYESQEKYYEQRLQEKVAQLEQSREDLATVEEAKNKLLSFISMVAHDLKAPLAAIQTYFGVMLGGYTGELSEKHRDLIEKSSARLDALFELISDLLDISRIETGQIVHEMEEVSLKELTGILLEDTQRLAEQKGLSFSADISPDLPKINGSALRLQQLFTNLLSNALKFTPEGGSVSLNLTCRDCEIVGEIEDSGVGIPEQDLPHVFEDFYRATNVEAPGTGLGLPIVNRILEAHGGQIKAQSPSPDSGKGCKFTFILPTG
ncbi:MAG: GAF domain-containing sensor histidine kinase [Chloroflexi bacterium]|jgi:signal transduction histidine kinase|nr:GAF domain-containing sensor histidine kinase [Chloroflexota bacterium]